MPWVLLFLLRVCRGESLQSETGKVPKSQHWWRVGKVVVRGGKLGEKGRVKDRGIKPSNNPFSLSSSPSLCVRGHRMETSNPCSQRRLAGFGNFAGKAFLGKSGKTVMWF